MSWQAADWMDGLAYDLMKPLATRVLLKLANVAAQDGTRAYRLMFEMANELGVDQRSIRRALRQLEEAQLILKGDQLHVAHYRGDRRPTVYNLNFNYHLEFAQPELPVEDQFEEPEEWPETGAEFPDNHGGTELSTGEAKSHGGTHDRTTEVRQGTKELLNNLNEIPSVLNREGSEEDASGAASGASAGAPAESPSGLHTDGLPPATVESPAEPAETPQQRWQRAIDENHNGPAVEEEFRIPAAVRRILPDREKQYAFDVCPARQFSPCTYAHGRCVDCWGQDPATITHTIGETA